MDSGFGADDNYNVYSKPMFDRGEVSALDKASYPTSPTHPLLYLPSSLTPSPFHTPSPPLHSLASSAPFPSSQASSVYRPKRDDSEMYGNADEQYNDLAQVSC